jgi:hypothetical protein
MADLDDEKWRNIVHPKLGPLKILHVRLSIDPGPVKSGMVVMLLTERQNDKKLFFGATIMEIHNYKVLYGNRMGMSCDAMKKNILKHYKKRVLPHVSLLYPLEKIKVVIESQFDAGHNYQNNYANPSNVIAAALYGYFKGRGIAVTDVRADRKFGMNEGLGDWMPSRDTRKIVATEINTVLLENWEWGFFNELHKLFILPADAPNKAYEDVHDVHDAALQAIDSILTDNPELLERMDFTDVIEKIKVVVAARRKKSDKAEAAKSRKRKARESTTKAKTDKGPAAKRQKTKE